MWRNNIIILLLLEKFLFSPSLCLSSTLMSCSIILMLFLARLAKLFSRRVASLNWKRRKNMNLKQPHPYVSTKIFRNILRYFFEFKNILRLDIATKIKIILINFTFKPGRTGLACSRGCWTKPAGLTRGGGGRREELNTPSSFLTLFCRYQSNYVRS